MGRVCTICAHPARTVINAALETDRSLRDIAQEFDISKTALHRHGHSHLTGQRSRVAANNGTPMAAVNRKRPASIKWGIIVGIGLTAWFMMRMCPAEQHSGGSR